MSGASAARGVVGINVFYRDVKDLIELINTAAGSEDDPEGDRTFDLSRRCNVGNGKVYGIEFDLSTDLGFIGLPEHRHLRQRLVARQRNHRFLRQAPASTISPDYVYNIGFIQDFAAMGRCLRRHLSQAGRGASTA